VSVAATQFWPRLGNARGACRHIQEKQEEPIHSPLG
ncbi:uncharacterized protein METZ01_LOCUS235938, partial [marine metagenome]